MIALPIPTHPKLRFAFRARARFATEKSDILTDARAYDECMRIRHEKSPSDMRAFCSEVRPPPPRSSLSNFHSILDVTPELHLHHHDPRHERPAERPPLRARLGRAHPSKSTRLSDRAQRTRRRARATQSAPPRRTIPARRTRRPPPPRDKIRASGERRGRARSGRTRVARDGHARRPRMGAPRQRTVRRDALALRHRRELRARRNGHQSLPPRRHRGNVPSQPGEEKEKRNPHLSSFLLFVCVWRSQVPLYALLLLGGHIAVDHVRGGLTVGGRVEGTLRLRAWPRIAILVQQLRCVSPFLLTFLPSAATAFFDRRLLDAALLRALNSGRVLEVAESPVIGAMLTLLVTDGMATNAGVGT